ncbi:glycoside hydrolase family 55 protein [Gluconobacter kondonii]|uniref:glycoside hydrolase family 55 protein n=1 Tax=Gluconobacter kondonii TaxID=941463 RepID=UPI00209EB20A|nr:glycoside hydrolase family 55 protein [Gluconobacter kondonii]MCP1235972.1 glycoside hydrolase family 55 protein [Gluconobacter kondonii]
MTELTTQPFAKPEDGDVLMLVRNVNGAPEIFRVLPDDIVSSPGAKILVDETSTARSLQDRFDDCINALDYGADSSADDNAQAFQQAIARAEATGKELYIPAGIYKYTPPLNFTAPVNIRGAGCAPLFGPLTAANGRNAINIPMDAPYFSGTVLMPASNGKSAFSCTGAGYAVSGRDFGVTFQVPFKNTGHMLDFQPVNSPSYANDIGLMGARWHNVGLYGHDGDHYMFNITNMLYNTFDSCSAFGGGFINSYTSTWQCGNSLFSRNTNMLIVGGAASGYKFSAVSNGNASQQLNTLIACQCNSDSQPFADGITPSAPVKAQSLIDCDENCHQFAIISPDMESLVGASSTLPHDMTFVDLASLEMAGAFRFAGSTNPQRVRDFFQGGMNMQNGTVVSSETTGTVSFSFPFYNLPIGDTPTVILTGVGINAKLSSAPEWNQFSYTLDAPGTFNWVAIGR